MEKIPYTEENLRKAVLASTSYSATLRKLGRRPAGGNHDVLKKKIKKFGIDISHFDPYQKGVSRGGTKARSLSEILVKDSIYNRHDLKKRLIKAGMLINKCSLCGQGDIWMGKPMSLVLDHINGVNDDNRISNLRLVCPNCNATLDTHCGRNIKIAGPKPPKSTCPECSQSFQPSRSNPNRKYCSAECHSKLRARLARNISKTAKSRNNKRGAPRPHTRKVKRPPYKKLLGEVKKNGYLATGRKYGVSDNAIRKWIKFYEKQ